MLLRNGKSPSSESTPPKYQKRKRTTKQKTSTTATAAIHEYEVDNDPERMRANLKTLPQEVYDMVYLEVFTATPGMRDIFGHRDSHGAQKHRSALNLMHVSHDTRALYTKTYYGPDAHFVFAALSNTNGAAARFNAWADLLLTSGEFLVLQAFPVWDLFCCQEAQERTR